MAKAWWFGLGEKGVQPTAQRRHLIGTLIGTRPQGRIPCCRHAWSPHLRGLLSCANAKLLAGIDDGEHLGNITALETERLVLGTDNMHHLSRV
jgi:hypothetical protein